MNTVPEDMLVEVTNRCNHACVFCAHRVMKNKKGEIDPVLLQRILQEAYDMGVRRVGLYTTGEMFLCKHIEEHIQNAKDIGYEYIYSDTNGDLATKERMKRMLMSGLDSIKFSINACSRETYKYIHGKDEFDIVLANLRDCYSLKEEMELPFKLMISFIVTSVTEGEVESFQKMVQPYCDELRVHPARTFFQQSGENISFLAPHGNNFKMEQCSMVFNRIHVTYNGLLTACCVDFNHDLILGDLNKTPLEEVWNSKTALDLRKRHMEGNLTGTMCYGCMKNEYHPYQPLS